MKSDQEKKREASLMESSNKPEQNWLICLLCGLKKPIQGFFSHIRFHLLYKRFACQDCSYECDFVEESVAHNFKTGHSSKKVLLNELDQLVDEIFRNCLIESGKSDTTPDGRQSMISKSKDTEATQSRKNSVVSQGSGLTSSSEGESVNVEPMKKGECAKLEPGKKGEPMINCRRCGMEVCDNYLSRREHAYKMHFDVEDEPEIMEMLPPLILSCFPGSKPSSDLECTVCGKKYVSNDGRKIHILNEHSLYSLKCYVKNCSESFKSVGNFKIHLKTKHNIDVSTFANSNIPFHEEVKRLNEYFASNIRTFFPCSLPKKTKSNRLNVSEYMNDLLKMPQSNIIKRSSNPPRKSMQVGSSSTSTSSDSSDSGVKEKNDGKKAIKAIAKDLPETTQNQVIKRSPILPNREIQISSSSSSMNSDSSDSDVNDKNDGKTSQNQIIDGSSNPRKRKVQLSSSSTSTSYDSDVHGKNGGKTSRNKIIKRSPNRSKKEIQPSSSSTSTNSDSSDSNVNDKNDGKKGKKAIEVISKDSSEKSKNQTKEHFSNLSLMSIQISSSSSSTGSESSDSSVIDINDGKKASG